MPRVVDVKIHRRRRDVKRHPKRRGNWYTFSVERQMDEKGFSIVERAKSFSHAGRGVLLVVKTTHNAWVQIAVLLGAVVAGFYFDISRGDWELLILAVGLVLATEAFNTAIEIDIDLTSPTYHPYARDSKDVAAGAVLIAAAAAAMLGVIIFGPHMLQLFGV